MNAAHQSRSFRRVIIGGITTMVVAGSTVVFAGEAAARPPRETTNTWMCTGAIANVARTWNLVQNENPTSQATIQNWENAKASKRFWCAS